MTDPGQLYFGLEIESGATAKRTNTRNWERHTQYDLAEYQDLINRFVDGRLGVAEFEAGYLRMFKEDSTIWPNAEYDILNDLFSAVDAYCEDPALRQPCSLDEEQLRREAEGAMRSLASLSGSV